MWELEDRHLMPMTVLVVTHIRRFHVLRRTKAFKEGRVNSPSRAAAKKVVVRQANTAASRGLERSNLVAKAVRMPMVRGARLGLLEDGGAKMAAPSKAAFISVAFMCQGAPCRVCQARTA